MTIRHRVFARMWGVAVIAHLAGNWRYGDIWPDFTMIGALLALVGVLGTALVLAPRRWMLLSLGAVVPLTAILEIPVLGNHWLLAAFVSVAYLLVGGDWEQFEPAARLILLVFYSFAAFAKLNSGFLDPEVSCGVFYANQWLGELGLGPVAARSPTAWATAWGSALIELSVPFLLVFKRTRALGAMLAIVFHGVISLDLGQHFYDFTAVLLPLLALFLGDVFFERFESVPSRLRPLSRKVLGGLVVFIGASVTLSSTTALTQATYQWLAKGSFIWWIAYLAMVVWAAAGAREPMGLEWRVGPVAVALAALVVLNGLTPYLELRTAFSWNMYSNLVTVDGESNHLIVRRTWPLRDGHKDMVTIVASSDDGLMEYPNHGYLLPWPTFLTYLEGSPDASVTFERAGGEFEIDRVGASELAGPNPWWWRWMPLRAVHSATPEQCQPTFLPAI